MITKAILISVVFIAIGGWAWLSLAKKASNTASYDAETALRGYAKKAINRRGNLKETAKEKQEIDDILDGKIK